MLNLRQNPAQETNSKQVLLCGTRYGQTYLSAIDECRDFDVCALLARGSERSVRLSEQRAIPLHHRVEKIEQTVDVACVAIGGTAGSDIAAALLERGIPVLIEHPLCGDTISHLLNVAQAHDTLCHINSHFPLIEPIAAFIGLCQRLNSQSSPRIVHVSCNSRTLFSTLDILMRCFGEFPDDIPTSTPVNEDGHYLNCSLALNSIPCTLLYQRWRGPVDDSRDAPLGHEITITYPEGVLRLGGTFGPCQWFPLVAAGLPYHMPVYDDYGCRNNPVTNLTVIEWRKQANLQAIRALLRSGIDDTTSDEYQNPAYLTRLCHHWDKWFTRLGTTTLAPDIEALKEAFTHIQAIKAM